MLYLREKSFDRTNTENIISLIEKESETEKPENLYCIACGNYVTSIRFSINPDGLHEHHFTNPAGFSYTIACFKEAAGCESFGDLTEEFTWFPGYKWNYGICTGCRMHLGWKYESSTDTFYGLIKGKLSPFA